MTNTIESQRRDEMKLSKGVFQKIRSWVTGHARPLEMARWEYLFENGSKDKVIRCLEAFQNEDGGFGHGIEPDFWVPFSSPMAAWGGSQILMEIDVNPQEEMVQNLVSYLVNTPQIRPGMWPSVLPENNEYPHAPWWHWDEGVQKNWMYNPSVELAACLIAWSPAESLGVELGWTSLEKAIVYVMQVTEMDQHEIRNFRNCLTILQPYEDIFNFRMNYSINQVEQKIRELTAACIDQDVSNWDSGYKALPLDFIKHPNDPLYDPFKTLVEQNLEFYVDQLSEEGVWDISWSWDQYPGEFPIARRHWQGILAVERCFVLKSFDWIDC